jgi:hypothetical protein
VAQCSSFTVGARFRENYVFILSLLLVVRASRGCV